MQISFEQIKWTEYLEEDKNNQYIDILIPFNDQSSIEISALKYQVCKHQSLNINYVLSECIPRILTQSQLLVFVQISLFYEYQGDVNDENNNENWFNEKNSYSRCILPLTYIIDKTNNRFQKSDYLQNLDLGTAVMLDDSTIALTGLQKQNNMQEVSEQTLKDNSYINPFKIQNGVLILNYIISQKVNQSKEIKKNAQGYKAYISEDDFIDEEYICSIKLETVTRNPYILCSYPSTDSLLITVLGGQLPYCSVACSKAEIFEILFNTNQISKNHNEQSKLTIEQQQLIQQQFQKLNGKYTQYDIYELTKRYHWKFKNYLYVNENSFLDMNVNILHGNQFSNIVETINKQDEPNTGNDLFNPGQMINKFPTYTQNNIKNTVAQDEILQPVICNQHIPVNACQLVQPSFIKPQVYIQQGRNTSKTIQKCQLVNCSHQFLNEDSEYGLQYLGALIGGINTDKKLYNWKKDSYFKKGTTAQNSTYEYSAIDQTGRTVYDINNEFIEQSIYGVYSYYQLALNEQDCTCIVKDKESKDYNCECKKSKYIKHLNVVIFKMPIDQILDNNSNLVLWQLLTGTLIYKLDIADEQINKDFNSTNYMNSIQKLISQCHNHTMKEISINDLKMQKPNTNNENVTMQFNQLYETTDFKINDWFSKNKAIFKVSQQSVMVYSRLLTSIFNYVLNFHENNIQIEIPCLIGYPQNAMDNETLIQLKLYRLIVSTVNQTDNRLISKAKDVYNQIPYGKIKQNNCIQIQITDGTKKISLINFKIFTDIVNNKRASEKDISKVIGEQL